MCQNEIQELWCIPTSPDQSRKQLHVLRFDMVIALIAAGFVRLLD